MKVYTFSSEPWFQLGKGIVCMQLEKLTLYLLYLVNERFFVAQRYFLSCTFQTVNIIDVWSFINIAAAYTQHWEYGPKPM